MLTVYWCPNHNCPGELEVRRGYVFGGCYWFKCLRCASDFLLPISKRRW